MKKKQLFAVLLAGSMTVGMAPAAAFAAEDTGAVTEAEAPTADENTETPDDGAAVDDQSQSEADAQAEAAAQAGTGADKRAGRLLICLFPLFLILYRKNVDINRKEIRPAYVHIRA